MECINPLNAIQSEKGMKLKILGNNKKAFKSIKDLGKGRLVRMRCGKCKGCRMTTAQMWANRGYLESKEYKHNYFITLTYANENLTIRPVIDNKTGEINNRPVLVRRELTKFIDKLKKHQLRAGLGKIKYMGSGEYGDQTKRPHYHLVIFNLKLNELNEIHRNEYGDIYYTNKMISKKWGMGNVIISPANHTNMSYTAQYTLKKQKIDGEPIEQDGVKEFTIKTPGLARDYYERNKNKIWENDNIPIVSKKKVVLINPPRYFDKLLQAENIELYEKIKYKREQTSKELISNRFKDVAEWKHLEIEERLQIQYFKGLTRTKI